MSEAAAARIVPPFALVGMISTGNEQKCPAAGGLAAYFCEGARDLGLRIAVPRLSGTRATM
ncbi:hypothetical protein [Rhizobium sp. P28RR-XV]|uniref:hypothetical protein n=1 Tax=Rhizobium sp. P28RR-XV TaxID=2726737 RepID=UPI00145737FA|nr:hypothetical protein [Rhizobium sp. P28RR-XV]NLR86549.1 hypothetical protein [Rhizobium sp. P28RR-XV]